MKDEISAAVVFITKIVRKSKHLNQEDVSKFSEQLARVLMARFRNHWYEENPSKGQGYRCIRISFEEPRDSALEKAAEASGLDYDVLNLPADMTLWVDPREVTCRFGERGTCCTIAAFERTPSDSEGESAEEDATNGNTNSNDPRSIRIPSPSTLMEQSQREEEDRALARKLQQRQNNYRNNLAVAHHHQYHFTPQRPISAARQPAAFKGDKFHWMNHGAIPVRS